MKRIFLSLLCAALVWLPWSRSGPGAQAAQPTHFSTTLGHSLLCMNAIEPNFIHDYLVRHFGPPYKREGGAVWFRVQAQLWDAPLTEVFVSDGSSRWSFIGAISSLPPEDLAERLFEISRTGVRFEPVRPGLQYSPLRARTGSEIVWQERNAKIFCKGDDPRWRRGRS